MRPSKLLNVIKQAVQPKRFPVMAKKLWKRVADDRGMLTVEDNLRWIKSQTKDFNEIVASISPSVWNESCEYWKLLGTKSKKTLASIKHDLGGGGNLSIFIFFDSSYQSQSDC